MLTMSCRGTWRNANCNCKTGYKAASSRKPQTKKRTPPVATIASTLPSSFAISATKFPSTASRKSMMCPEVPSRRSLKPVRGSPLA